MGMRFTGLVSFLGLFLAFATSAYAQSLEPLEHSHVAVGGKQIARAWLTSPTDRYKHFVLGDEYEAASLIVEMQNGERHQLDLPENLVFEDRHVRLADLDKDGKDEIVVVMSDQKQGAALAVFEAINDITLIAQTPFIGTPNRWLNPAGIADFDGDGRLEIALVQMPHLVKRLEFWRMIDGQLARVAFAEGFSNHRLGSRFQKLSAVHDVDHDGVADLIIPDADRTNLLAISLYPENRLIRTWEIPTKVDGDFVYRARNNRHVLRVRAISGKIHVIDLH